MALGEPSFLARTTDKVLFSTFDPFSVGLFRASLGALYVAFLLVSGPNWNRFYAPDGVNGLHYHDRTLSLLHLTAGFLPVSVYWWLGLAAALALTVGFCSRTAAALVYVLETSLIQTAPQVVNGEDLVFRMVLFWAIFMPLGHCLSVDAWLRAKRGLPALPPPTIWATRGLQANVALIYLVSQPNKLLDDPAWRDGSAIYLSMASNMWCRFPWPRLFYGPLSQLATWGSLCVELAFPLGVWFRRTRPYVLAAITLLHVGIAFMLANVTFFNLAMIVTFWIYLPGETTRAWFDKILGARRAMAVTA